MRALFTQLSLMVGLLTAFNLQTGATPVAESVLWGLSAGATVYLALLLGDYTVHRFLEERTDDLQSVVFVDSLPELTDDEYSRREDAGVIAA